MPVRHGCTEYPRMLFRGDDTLVVSNAQQKASALADGWQARALPGETDDELSALPERKKPGPKPKE